MKQEKADFKSKQDKLLNVEHYIAPDVKVNDIEIEQNILSGSPGTQQNSFNISGYEDEDW